MWGARRHRLWEGHRGGGSRLWVLGVIPFVGDGHHLWVLGVVRGRWVIIRGHWVFVRGFWVVDRRRWGSFAWSGRRSQAVGFVRVVGLFVPAGLSFVGAVVMRRVLGGHH